MARAKPKVAPTPTPYTYRFDGSAEMAQEIYDLIRLFPRRYDLNILFPSDDDPKLWELHLLGKVKSNRGIEWYIKRNDTVVIDTVEKTVRVYQDAPTVSQLPDKNAGDKAATEYTAAQLRYINHVAPEHCRTSCSDDSLYNSWYGEGDSLWGRCTRCTLLQAAKGYDKDDEDED